MLNRFGSVCAPQSGDCHQFPPLELAGCTRFAQGLSQGLPRGKRYAWPCPPKTVKHPASILAERSARQTVIPFCAVAAKHRPPGGILKEGHLPCEQQFSVPA